jgi:hypothetical protein
MEDLRNKKLARGDANVLLQGCNILLRAVDQGRRQAEYDEVRGEMAELRELFEKQRNVLDYG